jgi:hypothetical protein
MVVDCHVHLNNYHATERPSLDENVRRLRGQMEKWNLEACVVLSSYSVNESRPSVQQLVEALHGDPRIPIVEGVGLTTGVPVDWAATEERLRRGQVRGLKLYPGYEHLYPHSREFHPAIELAGRFKVPVMIHTGDTFNTRAKLKYAHPMEVDELCVDYPDIKFVMCHMGSPWFRTAAEILYKNPNAHADISGLILEEFTTKMEAWLRSELAEALLYSGEPDKIMYGTDWPLVRMGPYLRFVEALDIGPKERALLLRDNAARLFRIELPDLATPFHERVGTPRNLRAPSTAEESLDAGGSLK